MQYDVPDFPMLKFGLVRFSSKAKRRTRLAAEFFFKGRVRIQKQQVKQ